MFRLSPHFPSLALGVLVIWGCVSPESAHQGADSEAYALLEARRLDLFGPAGEFRIDPPENSLRQRILRGEVASLPSLNLANCLEIAAENSRDFQTQKEQLYGTALSLTLEQWNFGTQFTLGADATRTGSDGSDVQNDDASVNLGMSRLLGTGAQVVASVGNSLFRVVHDGEGWAVVRDASFSITQPLLGGSARAVVREPLTQAERDLIYRVRTFERFRRSFAFDVASRFYQLLASANTVANEETNSEGLKLLSLRNRALAEAGQLSDIEADQARQDELESENRLLVLREKLNRQRDEFKLFLGIPVATPLELAPPEVGGEPLGEEPLLQVGEEQALSLALSRRLDYLNTADSVIDAERRVGVAAEALRMGLNLEASAANSGSSPTAWAAGFSFDLPVNRIPERNAFRNSQIALETARRNEQESHDQMRADLRNEIRGLRNARQSYAIQKNAAELAEQRVASTELSLEAGRSNTRNVLEARRSLVIAQDSANSALTDWILARLSFHHQMELLTLGEKGFLLDSGGLLSAPSAKLDESHD